MINPQNRNLSELNTCFFSSFDRLPHRVSHINFNLYHYAGNNPVKYLDPDGRISQSKVISETQRSLEWSDFASIRDTQKEKLKKRDTTHSIFSWTLTLIGYGTGSKAVEAVTTIDGLLGVKPDDLANLTDSLQSISNTVADISQLTGESPVVTVTETTTVTATNSDSYGVGGAAFARPMMERSLTEKTTLDITINGVPQKTIIVSEKKISTYYALSADYTDFKWAE